MSNPNLTLYPLIDDNGMEWRFEGSRPVSQLADSVTKTTPKLCDDHKISEIKNLIESGLFPDLKFKI